MTQGSARLVVPLVLGFAGMTLAMAPAQAEGQAAASDGTASVGFAYQVNAFGSRSTVNGALASGPSAPTLLACAQFGDLTVKNNVDGVDLPPLLTTGPVSSLAQTLSAPVSSVGTNDVQNVDLLKGLVTADVLHSVSTTTQSDSGFQSDTTGSFLKSLQVGGKPIAPDVKPNTVIPLEGYGRVTVNEQVATSGKFSQSLTLNLLHLVVDQDNELRIPVGTSLVIADASSGVAGPVAGTVGGMAYGTRVQLGKTVASAPSYLASAPCFGTDGVVRTRGGDGIAVPEVLYTTAIADTAVGVVTPDASSSETTSSVESADLLQSLVVTKDAYADATAFTDGNKTVLSDGESHFGSLSVAGYPDIDASVPPNTRLVLSGLGTLWLHRVVQTATSIDVRMVELIVTKPNKQGLPVGSVVRIGVAHAIASSPSCLAQRSCG